MALSPECRLKSVSARELADNCGRPGDERHVHSASSVSGRGARPKDGPRLAGRAAG